MLVAGRFFAGSAVLYYLVAAVYWFVAEEVIGTTVLALTGGLATIIGVYMLFTARRLGYQPEDNLEGRIEEADAEYGHFSPHSWWPMVVGLFGGVVSVGFIFATWLLILGVTGLMVAITGWLFEYYRGDHLTW